MSRFTRRITATAAGPLVAAGILAGTLAVAARCVSIHVHGAQAQ